MKELTWKSNYWIKDSEKNRCDLCDKMKVCKRIHIPSTGQKGAYICADCAKGELFQNHLKEYKDLELR